MRFTLRLVAFTLLAALLYTGAVGVLALVDVQGTPLFEGLTRLVLRPSESGHTRLRMEEYGMLVAEQAPLDVLFVGSSLTYRGIDARVFEAEGLEVYALGLSSQTPLNYAPLLRETLPALRPGVVAFEAAPDLLQSDGLEALYAFAVNQPLGGRTLRMAAQVRSPQALNLVAALAWYRLRHPLDATPPLPADDPSGTYVGRGFTARAANLLPDDAAAQAAALPPETALRRRQRAALSASIARARRVGSRAVLVVPPTHPHFRAARPRLDAQIDTLRALAEAQGVPLFDLSRLPLDPEADFSDLTHLSSRGVVRYNRSLIARLRAAEFLPFS